MVNTDYGDDWQRKGATMSDKTARQEFGLTQDEIYDTIDAGRLQYRQAYMHGNPWLRLLRREVEVLARSSHTDRHVQHNQARAELTRVNRDIRRPRAIWLPWRNAGHSSPPRSNNDLSDCTDRACLSRAR